MRLGISQRSLAKLLELQAHSNIGDYERGRRIPPGDIVDECETVLKAPSGYLRGLWARAMSEQADEWTEQRLRNIDGLPGGAPAARRTPRARDPLTAGCGAALPLLRALPQCVRSPQRTLQDRAVRPRVAPRPQLRR
ncbi:hypothetical protein GCM10027570_46440 [Streptomonospora sediminis]